MEDFYVDLVWLRFANAILERIKLTMRPLLLRNYIGQSLISQFWFWADALMCQRWCDHITHIKVCVCVCVRGLVNEGWTGWAQTHSITLSHVINHLNNNNNNRPYKRPLMWIVCGGGLRVWPVNASINYNTFIRQFKRVDLQLPLCVCSCVSV